MKKELTIWIIVIITIILIAIGIGTISNKTLISPNNQTLVNNTVITPIESVCGDGIVIL